MRWRTLQETKDDERTGARAEVIFADNRWSWRVLHAGGQERGESATRKGAHAAVSKRIRRLPDREEQLSRQMTIFERMGT